MKSNLEYWQISLENPEPEKDDFYFFDEIIVKDPDFIQKVERLRELIITYCVISEKGESSEEIFNEIYDILIATENIQYTEFVAFWKVFDVSFSVFKNLSVEKKKEILKDLLKGYCERRSRLYDRLGYTNTTVQALYDSGASRKKGVAGVRKLVKLVKDILGLRDSVKSINEFKNCNLAYFLPDSKDGKEIFNIFLKEFNIKFQFGKNHQNKKPDIVLKVFDQIFIIEAKHVKESGGAQDKQISELIDFIKYSEKSSFVHYISFLDGVYFNKFIHAEDKVLVQRKEIENILFKNPNNFFVNTAGFVEILKDIKATVK